MKNFKMNVFLVLCTFFLSSCGGGGSGDAPASLPATDDQGDLNSETLTQKDLVKIQEFVDQFESGKTIEKSRLIFTIHKSLPYTKLRTFEVLDEKLDISCETNCYIQKK